MHTKALSAEPFINRTAVRMTLVKGCVKLEEGGASPRTKPEGPSSAPLKPLIVIVNLPYQIRIEGGQLFLYWLPGTSGFYKPVLNMVAKGL